MGDFNKYAGNGINPNGEYWNPSSDYHNYRERRTVVPYGTTPGFGEVGMGYRQAAPLAAAAAKEKARIQAAIIEQERLKFEAQLQEHNQGYAGRPEDVGQYQGGRQFFGIPEITYGTVDSSGSITPETTVAPEVGNNWFNLDGVKF